MSQIQCNTQGYIRAFIKPEKRYAWISCDWVDNHLEIMIQYPVRTEGSVDGVNWLTIVPEQSIDGFIYMRDFLGHGIYLEWPPPY